MQTCNRFISLLLALLLCACQEELTPRTTVDGLRILSISADPPEVYPGASSRINALIADPLGEGRTLDWFLTLCTPDAERGGCLELNELLEQYPDPDYANSEYARCCVRGGSATPSNGVLNLGAPGLTRLTTASTMLEGVTEVAALNGTNAQLNLIVCVSGVCTSSDASEGDSPQESGISLPPDQSALALKRLRVSTRPGSEVNRNPTLLGLYMNGQPVETGEELILEGGTSYQLTPWPSSTTLECYENLDGDGNVTLLSETPYFSWYATAGEFDEYFTEPMLITDCEDPTPMDERFDEAVNTWSIPPLESLTTSRQTLYLVMWDRRGGLTWLVVPVQII